MSDFDKHGLQGEISELVQSMNGAFLEIVDLFKEAIGEAEDKEDIIFIGNGMEGIHGLLNDYQVRLDEVLRLARKEYEIFKREEDALSDFEKEVMSSLDKIPMTDAYDAR